MSTIGVFENNLKICIHELFLIKNDFHIFYQLLLASTQKEKRKLKLCKKGYQWVENEIIFKASSENLH